MIASRAYLARVSRVSRAWFARLLHLERRSALNRLRLLKEHLAALLADGIISATREADPEPGEEEQIDPGEPEDDAEQHRLRGREWGVACR